MAEVIKFTFNPFQENTYLVTDATKECIIFDPGCYDQGEKKQLKDYIETNGLKPVRLINTHCHLDHIFGNKFVADTYGLDLEIHKGEVPVLEAVPMVCMRYGLPLPEESPKAARFIEEGEIIEFGETKLKTLFTPGHSPASISFYCAEDAFIIAGDVLFYESIGRTDLPGGDFATLANSIKTQFYTLPNDTKVYPGHGQPTTVGHEMMFNPFVK
ncbi:MAG: MBL fold metallo-hydrolase [Saprospiraceae bacterium]